ncbi:hypothetical protein PLCT2_02813 [Planctomycetaceae bacterium]|nr:hypothetical protein PLCT2_02813 [Planctomycetaceae bacterium]
MKAVIFVLALCGALATPAFAQEGAKPGKGNKVEGRERPGRGMRHRGQRVREALREKWESMTPEEREAAKAKAKEKMEEFRKKREEMKAKWEAMTPEEREAAKAKLKAKAEEMRAKFKEIRERLKNMSPEERKAEIERLRKEFREKRGEKK